MTLDPRPSDAELLERQHAAMAKLGRDTQVNGIGLGPDSPLRKTRKVPKTKAERDADRLANRIAHANDQIDPLGRMNKTERARAEWLEDNRRTEWLRSWAFEAIALILADRTRYHPDFLVVETDGAIRIEEVKGHWRDDARAKIKIAARLFPMFKFAAVRKVRKRHGGGWDVEWIHP